METSEGTTNSKQMPLSDITNQLKGETSTVSEKFVIKRNGESQKMSVDKIRTRLEKLIEGLSHKHINLDLIINKTVSYAQNGKDIRVLSFCLLIFRY